jgi:hypothetical protein
MPRDIHASTLTELTQDIIRPRLMVDLETTGSTLYYWSGASDFVWSSNTYLGNGIFRDIDNTGESQDGTDGIEIYLTGEPGSVVSLALQSFALNKQGKLWLAFLDSSYALIGNPILQFQGLLDGVELVDGPDQSTVILTYESDSILVEAAKNLRLNHETQQTFYSGDLGLEYTPQLEDWTGYWGRPNTENKGKKKKKNNTDGKKNKKKNKERDKERRGKRKKRKGRRKR